jgi:hypothetical protein
MLCEVKAVATWFLYWVVVMMMVVGGHVGVWMMIKFCLQRTACYSTKKSKKITVFYPIQKSISNIIRYKFEIAQTQHTFLSSQTFHFIRNRMESVSKFLISLSHTTHNSLLARFTPNSPCTRIIYSQHGVGEKPIDTEHRRRCPMWILDTHAKCMPAR